MPVPPHFAAPARAFLRVRQAALRVLDAPLPADAAVWLASTGTMRSWLLSAVCAHGVPDALDDGPATAEQLAARLDLDPDHLHRALRALALDGFFRLDRRGRFRLTRKGRALRAGELDGWLRYMALDSTQRAWAGMAEAIRTGQPPFPVVHGRSTWEHFAANPAEEQLFARTMRRLTQIDLPALVSGYPWPRAGVVCDVAGGTGTLLAGVLRARPGLRGVLVEAPGVLAEAAEHLAREGVADRVELREGSIFEHVDARADVYVLKDILHDWDDDRSAVILQVVARAMAAGSRLVLVEQLQERHRPEPVASWVDVQMLAVCDGGRQRSVAELHALLSAAGLAPGRVRRTAGAALVEGLRA